VILFYAKGNFFSIFSVNLVVTLERILAVEMTVAAAVFSSRAMSGSGRMAALSAAEERLGPLGDFREEEDSKEEREFVITLGKQNKYGSTMEFANARRLNVRRLPKQWHTYLRYESHENTEKPLAYYNHKIFLPTKITVHFHCT
jgi:hypothetical protein